MALGGTLIGSHDEKRWIEDKPKVEGCMQTKRYTTVDVFPTSDPMK